MPKKGDFFKHPNIVSDPLFQEYGLNDTKITEELYEYLKDKIDWDLFLYLQELQDKLARWQFEGIPFPREKIIAARDRLASVQQSNLDKVVDIRIGAEKTTKSELKGWNSSKLITTYIKKYKPEWIPYLKLTSTKQFSFDKEARELLMEQFPNDLTLKAVYSIKTKN